jgi:hypothetical protein
MLYEIAGIIVCEVGGAVAIADDEELEEAERCMVVAISNLRFALSQLAHCRLSGIIEIPLVHVRHIIEHLYAVMTPRYR